MSEVQVIFYRDQHGMYRWKCLEEKGVLIAKGGSGYTTLGKCEKDFERVKEQLKSATVKMEISH